mmetsp:Transcript_21514/g.68471  ORF Transcript_21514/g.68471 Transcript_21514/m.68471 type:complete len:228 (+) Transcript_21514:537-1220(+)
MRTSSKSGRDAHTQMAWLSTCVVQRNSPPGETVIDVAAYSNEYQPMSAPDGTSTTRSVQSSADERTQRASAPHATSVSVFVCPSSCRTSRSATASITRTERSSAARATRVESRLWRSMPHAHPTSAVDCSLRAAGAHRRSVPSPPQEKRVRPSAAAARPRTAPSCRSSAVAAARGMPDCKLYLSMAPIAEPRKAKLPHAEMATAVMGAAGRAASVCGASAFVVVSQL